MSATDFTWSYSSLKDYINCPRQYHEVKVLKRFTKRVTPQMRYGTEVHSAIEDYVREGKPLKKNYEIYKPMLDAVREIPGEKFCEFKMALDRNMSPCSYGKDYWVRGIADLVVIDGDSGFVIDYKTGSNKYPDPNQLKLMAIMAFAHFPELQSIKAGLLFVAHASFVTEEYTRDMVSSMWEKYFAPDLDRLRGSYTSNVWNPNQTPLCGWCPVDTCEYHRG
jgi:hypothetical protein